MRLTYRAKASQCLIIVGFAVMSVWCVTVAAKHEFVDVKLLVQSRDHKPVVGASVVIQRPSGDKESKTDERGSAEFTHVEFEVTRPYTVKISATDYKPQDWVITAAEFEGSVKTNIPIDHTVILESTEPLQPINVNKPDNSGLHNDNQNSNRNQGDNWYDPVIDLLVFLRSFWGLLFSVLIVATVAVLLLMGYRIKVYRNGQPLPTVKENIHWIQEDTKSIKADVKEVKKNLEQFVAQQHSLTSGLTAIESRLKEIPIPPVPPIAGQSEPSTHSSGDPAGAQTQPASQPYDYYSTTQSPEKAARNAYQALMRNEVPLVDPIYVRTDIKSSPLAGLENDDIYLQAVGNTQGAFVLFPDPDGRSGQVFPNPGVDFRPETLKRLFPKLAEMGETQFQAIKSQIDPVRVRQIEPSRWVVE